MVLQINSSTSFLSNDNDTAANDFHLERSDTVRNTLRETKHSMYLVLMTVVEALVVIALEAVLFANFQSVAKGVDISEGLTKGIPVYLMIFIFSLVFQIGLAWDAVHKKNTIQIIAFILFNLCCFIYAVFQFNQIAVALKTRLDDQAAVWELQKIMIANPIVIGICQLAYFYLGVRLYREFGWSIYTKIGADSDNRKMYRWYQIFLTILKLDIFFFLGFSVQYLVLVLQSGDVEYPLTIVALPLTCVVLVLAVYAVKHESKILISLFFVGLAAGVAYFIFKIVRMYSFSEREKYEFVRQFLTFFAVVTLILLILTTINAVICWRNFGKGLKPHLLRNSDEPSPNTDEIDGGRVLSLD